MARYVVGIDLGTTNSALAYIDLQPGQSPPAIQVHGICQLIRPGEHQVLPLLPSFLYLGGGPELPPGAADLPWTNQEPNPVGEFARLQGMLVPSRLVSSAKSWLCHSGVDRLAPLLPWPSLPGLQKLSPVEVATRYLRHLADSWNYSVSQGELAEPIEQQPIVLTVPASFDDVARNLTLECAQRAGFKNIALLEEPQAAFYRWLAGEARQKKKSSLEPGMLCLVVDVGGGTSDFTLIETVEDQGELGFARRAVGDHLLLGGDNMDLALAKLVEGRIARGKKLDGVQFCQLVCQCREAKEKMLGANPPPQARITLTGRGASIIGSTLMTTLDRREVEDLLIDGFFPFSGPNSLIEHKTGGAGLHEFGLPFESDPGITRHLSEFLRKQSEDGVLPAPAALLFNGGVFRSQRLQKQVLEVLATWFGKAWHPLMLENPSVDLAVAEGAAWYAWLKQTGGKRIGGGSGRSYYLGVETQEQHLAEQLLCVLPRNQEEGKTLVLDRMKLDLALGQPVSFPLFTSTVRGHDQPGQVLTIAKKHLRTLPPLQTLLRGGRKAGVKTVPVQLSAHTTPLGTLELHLQSVDGGNQWKLEFNVREIVEAEDDEPVEMDGETWPEEATQGACDLLSRAFQGDSPTPRELVGELERTTETRREDWPLGACRKMWDHLLLLSPLRTRSVAHASRWTNLAGYLLRPGFGSPGDKMRLEKLWKELQGPPRDEARKAGMARPMENGADFWILWRRVAAGLIPNLQNALFDRVKGVLLPNPNRPANRPPANEWVEMWRAAASMERLSPQVREELGNSLILGLKRQPLPAHLLWSFTRLGARTLVHGPLNSILHPEVVSNWLEQLLDYSPQHKSEEIAWAFCLSQLARITGQRALDIGQELREKVLGKLSEKEVPNEWVRSLKEYVPLARESQSNLLGDSLPKGLRLPLL